MIKKKNIGSSLEDFLQDEGQLEKARQIAEKRVLDWQTKEAKKKQKETLKERWYQKLGQYQA